MDISSSVFWQHILLAVLLIPYFVGICISTYYAQKQRKSEMLREASQHLKKQ
jgi:hypothetical protein